MSDCSSDDIPVVKNSLQNVSWSPQRPTQKRIRTRERYMTSTPQPSRKRTQQRSRTSVTPSEINTLIPEEASVTEESMLIKQDDKFTKINTKSKRSRTRLRPIHTLDKFDIPEANSNHSDPDEDEKYANAKVESNSSSAGNDVFILDDEESQPSDENSICPDTVTKATINQPETVKPKGKSKNTQKQRKLTRAEYLKWQMSRPTITFRVNRERHKTFGSKYIFKLYLGDEVLFFAKAKGIFISKVVICQGREAHLSQGGDAVLMISGMNEKNYDLYFGSEADVVNKKMITKVKSGGYDNPRVMEIAFIGAPPKKYPAALESRKPYYNEKKNSYQLDFLGKFVISSIRNCIIDGPNMRRAFIIRKTTKDDLEIECLKPLDPVYVFTLGLASFLG